jgi:putative hemolysin
MKLLLIALVVFLVAGCISQVPECSRSSDCQQPLCPGTTAKCISGKCVNEYSNGTLANCTNTSIDTRAANYCMNQGYEYKIETDSHGTQTGYCYVNQTSSANLYKCEQWAFYRGECPACKDYCESMPHIECVGYWNISGSFPNCQCNYACSPPANNMNKSICETYGGHWNECGSACTGEPPGTICPAVCIAQCECGGAAGWKCPPGYNCKLSGRVANELGVCR